MWSTVSCFLVALSLRRVSLVGNGGWDLLMLCLMHLAFSSWALSEAGSIPQLSEDVSSPSFVILMHLLCTSQLCPEGQRCKCDHPSVTAYSFIWRPLWPPRCPLPSLLSSELNSSSLQLQLSLRETAQIKELSPTLCFSLMWAGRLLSVYLWLSFLSCHGLLVPICIALW